MALGVVKQSNIVINKARHLAFFEGTNLCFNYKTMQWTRIPAYDGLGPYSVNSKVASFGLVRYSFGSVELQTQFYSAGAARSATLITAAPNITQGERAMVSGVRPIHNDGTATLRVGSQDEPEDAVSYSTFTSVNSRSGMANFRKEGRYHRVEIVMSSGGFDTLVGADIEFFGSGRI